MTSKSELHHVMRVGLGQIDELTDENLAFIKQLGVNDIQMNTPILPGDRHWEHEHLAGLKERAATAGLRLMAIENVPITFVDKIMLGSPGRDEQIEHMQTTVRNMGRAGIRILGYQWMPNRVWRTEPQATLRGGARGTRFNLAEHGDDVHKLTHGRTYTEEEMWDNYAYYMERILPVAEEAGVTMALHPDDPPLPSLGGIARIFRNFEGFQRAMDVFDSPNHGLNFCLGCWSEMGAGGVISAIRYFGDRKKLVYVHFRFVRGTLTDFSECFINEGSVDPWEVVKALKQVGFTGFMMPDHVPTLAGDTPWGEPWGYRDRGGYRGRAHAVGYMTALLDVLEKT